MKPLALTTAAIILLGNACLITLLILLRKMLSSPAWYLIFAGLLLMCSISLIGITNIFIVTIPNIRYIWLSLTALKVTFLVLGFDTFRSDLKKGIERSKEPIRIRLRL